MLEMFSRVMPVMLLFALGYIIRQKAWITSAGMVGVKKIVINFALPAVLFKTFLTMEFKVEYFALSFSIIVMMSLMFLAGKILNKIKGISHLLNPYLATGFSFGLLGIPLFAIVFGEENLGILSVIGLGHELFVWFIYYTILHMQLNNESFSVKHFAGFFKSPVIIAIFIGMALNLRGIAPLFSSNYLLMGILRSVDYMGSVATPLILLTVGYAMEINMKYMLRTLKLVMVRLVVVFAVGYAFKVVVINNIVEVTPMLNYAYMTFLMLPPLFSLPIFVGISGTTEDEELASNAVVSYTALSLVLFILVAIIFL